MIFKHCVVAADKVNDGSTSFNVMIANPSSMHAENDDFHAKIIFAKLVKNKNSFVWNEKKWCIGFIRDNQGFEKFFRVVCFTCL